MGRWLRAGCVGVICAMGMFCLRADGKPTALESGRSALAARAYGKAATLLAEAAVAKNITEPERQEAAHLRVRALYLKKEWKECVAAADAFLAAAPDSPWKFKTAFLKAQALVDLKAHGDAAQIYGEQALRLSSLPRKEALAAELVSLGNELVFEPDPALPPDPDAPKPDFNKAVTLYDKALSMEMGHAMRAEVLLKRAGALVRAQRAGEAVTAYRQFLWQFDPAWEGAEFEWIERHHGVVEVERLCATRLALAHAMLWVRDRANAMRTIEDLQKMLTLHKLERTPLAADAAWLKVAFQQKYPDGRQALEQSAPDAAGALKAAHDFLAAWPDDPRALHAAILIPQLHAAEGRTDEALAAYELFLKGDAFRLPSGPAADAKHDTLGVSPRRYHDDMTMLALFTKATLLRGQKKFAEAKLAFEEYIRRFPSGPNWSGAMGSISAMEYEAAVLALVEGRDAEARTRFEAYIEAHPLDGRVPEIMLILGQMHIVAAQALEKDKAPEKEIHAARRAAIDAWADLIGKYRQSTAAAQALLRTGALWEDKLANPEKALEAYRQLASLGGPDSGHAQERISLLTEKTLALSTARTFRTDEKAFVRATVRNVEKLTLRSYALNLEAYFRKTHGTGQLDQLDIALIQPNKVWEITVDGFATYRPFEQDIEIPFDGTKPGVCIVVASDGDREASALLIRSDIDIIAKTSRREALVFAQNRLTNTPAEGVRVLLSDGSSVFETGVTGKDGVWRAVSDKLREVETLRVFAVQDGHVAANNLGLQGLGLTTGLLPKGYLYTARHLYQPGEEVEVRGVLRVVTDGAYVIPQGHAFALSVSSPAGMLLHREDIALSAFGTFDARCRLPDNAAEGAWKLLVTEKEGKGLVFSGTFGVGRMVLEKVRMEMTFDKPVYFRGEPVDLTLTALHAWGEPLVARAVRVTLPDGRIARGVTDQEGLFRHTFDTTGMMPGEALFFHAFLDAEQVNLRRSVPLAVLEYHLAVNAVQDVALAGEPFDVTVRATGADGKPFGAKTTLALVRLVPEQADSAWSGFPGIPSTRTGVTELTESEIPLVTDATSGSVTTPVTLTKGGAYLLRVTGTDRHGQTVRTQTRMAVSGDDDTVKLRLFAPSDTLRVGDTASLRLHARLDRGLALVTQEGETILHYVVQPLVKGDNPVAFAVGHEHFPNMRISVSVIDGRELRSARKDFRVERELRVAVEAWPETMLPGAEQRFRLRVTDQLGKPVAAELSVAVVEEALFAYRDDPTTPIRDFFQKDATRRAEFREGSSCGFAYQGAVRLVSAAEKLEESRHGRIQNEMVSLRNFRSRSGRKIGGSIGSEISCDEPSPSEEGSDCDYTTSRLDEGMMADHDQKKGDRSEMTLPVVGRLSKPGSALVPYGETGRERSQEPTAARLEEAIAHRWLPAIVTGADGLADVTLPMPEKTTRWRLVARGCTVETLVGDATAYTVTRKDFFVTMRAPQMLREGDSVRIAATVHNLTEMEGTAELTLTIAGSGPDEAALAVRTLSIAVPARGQAQVVFDTVKAPAVSRVKCTVAATMATLSDALARSIPIEPWGMEYAAHGGGTATSDAAVVLTLPADIPYTRRNLLLSVSPSVNRTVLDLALRQQTIFVPLHRPEWNGCVIMPPVTESDAGRLLAAVAGLRYARKTGAPEEDIRALSANASASAAALMSTQENNGGWMQEYNTNPPTAIETVMAYRALVEARHEGIGIDDAVLVRTAVELKNRLPMYQATDGNRRAHVLYGLSFAKEADFTTLNRLHRERAQLGDRELAYLALAFSNQGRADMAAELAQALAARPRMQPDAHGVWLEKDSETVALAVSLFSRVPALATKAGEGVTMLLGQGSTGGGATPHARGLMVAALAEHFGTALWAKTDLEIEILVNGEKTATVRARGDMPTRLFEHALPDATQRDARVEFRLQGRGTYVYAVTLLGFSPVFRDPGNWGQAALVNRTVYHAGLEYDARPIGAASTSPILNLACGQRTRVQLHSNGHYNSFPFMIEEPLPAGAILGEGSVGGNFIRYEILDGKIRAYYHPMHNPDLRYELMGYAAGEFRLPPPVLRDIRNPARMRVWEERSLTVLAPGEVSPDPYHMNINEKFWLGRAHFNDGDYAGALGYLSDVFKQHRTYSERELARMLLWIHTDERHFDARRAVDMLEILLERHPDQEIPLDKLLTVGKAYRALGEHERAWLVFRAIIDADFRAASGVSASIQDMGRFHRSIAYQKDLWRDYPDSADVVTSWFALSQALYQQAPAAHTLDPHDPKRPNRVDMLSSAADMIEEFLWLYPEDPLADDAAFSLTNAYLDLKQYAEVSVRAPVFEKRYAESPLASSFAYMTALGLFWQHDYARALGVARTVAEGTTDNRDFARYIMAQIQHASGRPAEAIEWYGMVKELYPDAKEAIEYFEEKRIALEEVTTVRPGTKTAITLTYRNIPSAFVQVYRVDLMKLYLREKNLSRIAQVRLAGIEPLIEKTFPLGDGKDYAEKRTSLELDLTEDAAYLVICRGEDLFASGLVLVTPLDVRVQEYPGAGRLRATVVNATTGAPCPNIHVKAVGSGDGVLREGETDLRGLFVADNLLGNVTVIVKENESRYGFYRGTTWLGAAPGTPRTREESRDSGLRQKKETGFQQNLMMQNSEVQQFNVQNFDSMRRQQNAGVKVQSLF